MSEGLWAGFEIEDGKSIPHISGRVACEEDVKTEKAVFFLEEPGEIGARPYDITLPHCGIWTDEDTGNEIPIVLIQAEQADDRIYVGFRFLGGGNGMGLLSEIELLDRPDNRFISETALNGKP